MSETAKQNSPFVNPELHPNSTLQQLQINSNNQSLKDASSQNSPKKCRLALLTSSQSLSNFYQQSSSSYQQNYIVDHSTEKKDEDASWGQESLYLYRSSSDRTKSLGKGKTYKLNFMICTND